MRFGFPSFSFTSYTLKRNVSKHTLLSYLWTLVDLKVPDDLIVISPLPSCDTWLAYSTGQSREYVWKVTPWGLRNARCVMVFKLRAGIRCTGFTSAAANLKRHQKIPGYGIEFSFAVYCIAESITYVFFPWPHINPGGLPGSQWCELPIIRIDGHDLVVFWW